MADPMTDRFTDESGADLQPNDLGLILDDKNSVMGRIYRISYFSSGTPGQQRGDWV